MPLLSATAKAAAAAFLLLLPTTLAYCPTDFPLNSTTASGPCRARDAHPFALPTSPAVPRDLYNHKNRYSDTFSPCLSSLTNKNSSYSHSPLSSNSTSRTNAIVPSRDFHLPTTDFVLVDDGFKLWDDEYSPASFPAEGFTGAEVGVVFGKMDVGIYAPVCGGDGMCGKGVHKLTH